MTKKKTEKKVPEIEKLEIPQDIKDSYGVIMAELELRKFTKKSAKKEINPLLIGQENFTNSEQSVILEITKEHITIRQFKLEKGGKRTLLVIYVVKPSHRKFVLLQPKEKSTIKK
jgi:hypothetical protein